MRDEQRIAAIKAHLQRHQLLAVHGTRRVALKYTATGFVPLFSNNELALANPSRSLGILSSHLAMMASFRAPTVIICRTTRSFCGDSCHPQWKKTMVTKGPVMRVSGASC